MKEVLINKKIISNKRDNEIFVVHPYDSIIKQPMI